MSTSDEYLTELQQSHPKFEQLLESLRQEAFEDFGNLGAAEAAKVFCSSLIGVIKLASRYELLKDTALHQLTEHIPTDSRDSFERRINDIVDHLKDKS